ncbi:MAG: hypothetical protein ACAI34_13530 [Verrucomicrobium sp.]|nr:hypothetical protein [Verrucomicrobium sp.]
MAFTPAAPLDLSDLTAWRGLHPGMPRKEVCQVLVDQGVDLSDWDEEDDEFFILEDDWGFQLVFDDKNRLFQLSAENDEHLWSGKKVIDVRLHEALLAMQPVVAGAGWRVEDPTINPLGEGREAAAAVAARSAPPSDAKLLYEGTLWLPGPGLGLIMCGGAVCEIVWRETHRLPKPFVSEVTASQLELSQMPELDAHLRKLTGREVSTERKKMHPLQKVLTGLWLTGVVFLGALLWSDLQVWKEAPILPGSFVSTDWVQGKIKEQVYHVEYLDPEGQARQATLKRADFYVAPDQSNAPPIQLRYLAGPPVAVYGIARSAHPVIERIVPPFLWVMGIYFAGSMVLSFLLRMGRGAKK